MIPLLIAGNITLVADSNPDSLQRQLDEARFSRAKPVRDPPPSAPNVLGKEAAAGLRVTLLIESEAPAELRADRQRMAALKAGEPTTNAVVKCMSNSSSSGSPV